MNRPILQRLLVLSILLAAGGRFVGDGRDDHVSAAASPLQVSLPATTAVPVAAVAFVEGPAATDAGDLYFTDLLNNRIWRRTAAGALEVYAPWSNYANGLAIDREGRLLAAENGDPARGTPPRLTRTNLRTGQAEVLAESFNGRAFNAPNDVVVDGKGRIFFTDWARPDILSALPDRPRNPFAVYRIDPDGGLHQVLVAPQVEAPNGVMISPDDRTMYLVESNRGLNGARRIVAYSLGEDGTAGTGRTFHDFFPGRSGDGMAVDTAGNLWVAAGLNYPRPGSETLDTRGGVYVFAPDGHLIRMIPVAQDLITNVAFGGPDRRTVYITAGNTVFSIASEIGGTRR